MTLTTVSRQLTTIADTLKHVPDSYKVAIRPNSDDVCVVSESNSYFSSFRSLVFSCISRVASCFGCSIRSSSVVHPADIQGTKKYFEGVFGEKRIARINTKASLNFKGKELKGTPFFRSDVTKIFVAAGEVTLKDFQELFDEIKDPEQDRIRYYDREMSKSLRELYRKQNTLGQCSHEQLKRLHKLLCPFAKVEEVFLHKLPIQPTGFLENAVMGMQKRVYVYNMIQRLSAEDPLWALTVAKELTGRSPPLDVLIPHKDGYFQNMHNITDGGARIYFLKSIGSGSKKVMNQLLFQGTVLTCRKSIRDVMNVQMGSLGIQKNYNELSSYLHDPEKGFVSSVDEQVGVIGVSLGGVQAMRAKILFGKKIERVVVVCSPGLDRPSAELYKKVKSVQDIAKFTYVFEEGDHIDEFGETRLGANLDQNEVELDFYTITKEKTETVRSNQEKAVSKDITLLPPVRLPCPSGTVSKIRRVLVVGFGRHLQPVIGRTITLQKLSNKKPEEKQAIDTFQAGGGAYHDPRWEEFRHKVGKRLGLQGEATFVKFAEEVHNERRKDIEMQRELKIAKRRKV